MSHGRQKRATGQHDEYAYTQKQKVIGNRPKSYSVMK